MKGSRLLLHALIQHHHMSREPFLHVVQRAIFRTLCDDLFVQAPSSRSFRLLTVTVPICSMRSRKLRQVRSDARKNWCESRMLCIVHELGGQVREVLSGPL